MLIGDPARFALESEVTCAFARPSAFALGYFVIHLGGRMYGVGAPDATLLACSRDGIEERLRRRGLHTMSGEWTAEALARHYLDGTYGRGEPGRESNLVVQAVTEHGLLMAPDGDEAFDDGSHILHIDMPTAVRLIGFRNSAEGLGDLREVCIEPREFYPVLGQWLAWVEAEWQRLPKRV